MSAGLHQNAPEGLVKVLKKLVSWSEVRYYNLQSIMSSTVVLECSFLAPLLKELLLESNSARSKKESFEPKDLNGKGGENIRLAEMGLEGGDLTTSHMRMHSY